MCSLSGWSDLLRYQKTVLNPETGENMAILYNLFSFVAILSQAEDKWQV